MSPAVSAVRRALVRVAQIAMGCCSSKNPEWRGAEYRLQVALKHYERSLAALEKSSRSQEWHIVRTNNGACHQGEDQAEDPGLASDPGANQEVGHQRRLTLGGKQRRISIGDANVRAKERRVSVGATNATLRRSKRGSVGAPAAAMKRQEERRASHESEDTATDVTTDIESVSAETRA